MLSKSSDQNIFFSKGIPVCILSPTSSSDILNDFPFSMETSAVAGKQPHLQHTKDCGMP